MIRLLTSGARGVMASVVEGARPPTEYNHASFEVHPEGAEATRLIWTTDVLPDILAAGIRIRMQHGALEMKETIEAAAPIEPDLRRR